jgi:hypothetical protein
VLPEERVHRPDVIRVGLAKRAVGLLAHRGKRLQRARYHAELAERRYQAVDPDNRLVAATLERQWEEALRSERTLHAEATIRWAGGYESRHAFLRHVRRYDQLRDGDRLMQRLVELREAGKTAEQPADILNAEGFRPINPRDTFNRDMVRDLLVWLRLRGEHRDDWLLGPGEWWIHDLAAELGMAWQTLRHWATRGWVHGPQTKILKRWVVWADRTEVKRLRRLRSARSRGILGYPRS